MTRIVEKTNPRLTSLISLLKNKSRENEAKIWREIANRLETPNRNYAEVNLSKINRYAQNGETIIVPGKVLGSGVLEQSVKIAALNFSASATSKIREAKGKKVQVAEGKLPDCSMCRLCERACLASGIGDEPAIKISAEPDRFIFVVESDGSLPAKEIMNRALSYIREQADELEKQLGEISGDEKK